VEGLDGVDEQLVRQLADRTRAKGLRLTDEGGLLARLTKLAMRRPSPVFAAAETCRADDHIQAVREERTRSSIGLQESPYPPNRSKCHRKCNQTQKCRSLTRKAIGVPAGRWR
jgi:hypothetical protein